MDVMWHNTIKTGRFKMKRIVLSACLVTISTTALADSINLKFVKGTKYNVVGAVFRGNCLGIDAKKVKAIIEDQSGSMESYDLEMHMRSLKSKSILYPLHKLATDVGATCMFWDEFVVLGRFPHSNESTKTIEEVNNQNIPIEPGTPITVVAYKKPTVWNPNISLKSRIGYDSSPAVWSSSGNLGNDTFFVMATKKPGGFLHGRDAGLEIKPVTREAANEAIKKANLEMNVTQVTSDMKGFGFTKEAYAAGIKGEALGMQINRLYGPLGPSDSNLIRTYSDGTSTNTEITGFMPGGAEDKDQKLRESNGRQQRKKFEQDQEQKESKRKRLLSYELEKRTRR